MSKLLCSNFEILTKVLTN